MAKMGKAHIREENRQAQLLSLLFSPCPLIFKNGNRNESENENENEKKSGSSPDGRKEKGFFFIFIFIFIVSCDLRIHKK